MPRPSLVVVTDPDGSDRSVVCRDGREALAVVLEESKAAEPMTIMIVYDLMRDKPVDRWGISKDGDLVHSPYCK